MSNPVLLGVLLVAMAFFVGGFLMVSRCWPSSTSMQRVALGFPFGYSVWATVWIMVVVIRGENIAVSSQNVWLSLVIFAGIVFAHVWAVPKSILRSNAHGFLFFSALVAVFFLVTIVFLNGHYNLTWDSYYLINWAQDFDLALEKGYPLVNLGNANLSAVISADFYNFSVHPVIGLSLLVFLGSSIHSFSPAATRQADSYLSLLVTTILGVVFSSALFFQWQSFYINHHLIFGVLLLALSCAVLGLRKANGWGLVFVCLLCLGLTVSRMEGFLFVLLALAILLPFRKSSRERWRIAGSAVAACTPYLLYLVFGLPAGGFVSSFQYAVMLIAGAVLFFFFRFGLSERFISRGRTGLFIISVLCVALAGAILIKPGHMLESIGAFAVNVLRLRVWGGVSLIIMATIPVLLGFRLARGRLYRRHDAFLILFFGSITLLLFLVVLRSPLHSGSMDSANRMLMHFIPLALVWVGVEVLCLGRAAGGRVRSVSRVIR